VAEVSVDARRTAPVRRAPLWLPRLSALPPLPLPPVLEDPDLVLPCELLRQITPKVGLVPRHDDQAPIPVP